MTPGIPIAQAWNPPESDIRENFPRRTRYCICVFVLNELGRLQDQLAKMKGISGSADIIIADGGSSDGCVDESVTKPHGVRSVLTKRGPGRLGAQIRMAFAYALEQGYEGVVTVDGNDKDDVVSGLPLFLNKLNDGFDHIQGSRFIAGGQHRNTPFLRLLGVKLLHAPLISFAAGFRFTDTTNGFRAYSRKFLKDQSIAENGSTRSDYDLHYYLAVNGATRGFRSTRVPVSRVYPEGGKVPTKIKGLRSNGAVLSLLFRETLIQTKAREDLPKMTFFLRHYKRFALFSIFACLFAMSYVLHSIFAPGSVVHLENRDVPGWFSAENSFSNSLRTLPYYFALKRVDGVHFRIAFAALSAFFCFLAFPKYWLRLTAMKVNSELLAALLLVIMLCHYSLNKWDKVYFIYDIPEIFLYMASFILLTSENKFIRYGALLRIRLLILKRICCRRAAAFICFLALPSLDSPPTKMGKLERQRCRANRGRRDHHLLQPLHSGSGSRRDLR